MINNHIPTFVALCLSHIKSLSSHVILVMPHWVYFKKIILQLFLFMLIILKIDIFASAIENLV